MIAFLSGTTRHGASLKQTMEKQPGGIKSFSCGKNWIAPRFEDGQKHDFNKISYLFEVLSFFSLRQPERNKFAIYV